MQNDINECQNISDNSSKEDNQTKEDSNSDDKEEKKISFYKKKDKKRNEENSDKENDEEKEDEEKKKKKSTKYKKRKNEEFEDEEEEEEYNDKKYKKKKEKNKKKRRKESQSDSSSEDSYSEYLKWKEYQKKRKKKKKEETKKNKKNINNYSSQSSSEENEKEYEKPKKKKVTFNPNYVSDEKENNSSEENSSDSQSDNCNTKTKKQKNIKKETPKDCFAAPLQISKLTPNSYNDQTYYFKIIKIIGEYLKIFLKFGGFFPEFTKEEKAKQIKKFIEKYSLFFNIKRFSIPVFGTISCGKSSFLNYLLKLHKILETNEDIATKFVCFIRHSKGLKKPKIYSVKFEPRDSGKYNFEKDKELKGDVKEIIKERNKFIKEGNGKREPSNYFLIVESDIPLFHGENEKYSPFFEFLDFPGLDEVKSGESSLKENTYFKDFLPLIQPNIMFSLFLFDLNSYESTSGKEIFRNYIFNKDENMSKMLKGTLYKSLYILNQIDKELKLEKDENKRIEVKEKREEHFREKMKENFKQILNIENLEFSEGNSISLSAKILELEEYKLKSFPKFIEYIISLVEMENEKNFKQYLNKKLKEILNIPEFEKSKIKSYEITEEIEDELEEVNSKLSNVHLVGNNFILDDYYFYRKLFKKHLNNAKINEVKEDIQFMILNQIKTIFDNFFNLEEFKSILEYVDNNSKEFVEYSKKISENLSNLTKNPKSIEHPISLLENITNKIKNFLLISKESKTIQKLVKDSETLLNYVKNQLSIRFLFLGRHSSGKTSLINSFLGKDLLQTSAEECTMSGFVIKNIDDISQTSIYESRLVANTFGYYYFEKKKKLALGIDSVRNTIKDLNDNKKKIKKNNSKENNNSKELNFYIIEVPINIFKIAGIDKEIYSKIELIDIPGLDTGYDEAIRSSEKLLDFTDGFIFANPGKQLDNNDNRVIINNIIGRISKRPNFSFNTCLFVLTRADESENKIDIKISRMKIQEILREGFESKNFSEIIRDKEAIKNKDNLLVTAFSNIIYRDYLKSVKDLEELNFLQKNLSKTILDLKNNYMEIEETDFNYYKSNTIINEDDEKYQEIVSILKQKYKFTDEQIINNKNKIFEIMYITSYILKNTKKLVNYQFSYGENLCKLFKNQINNAYRIYENNLKIMCVQFFFENLTPLAILRNSIKKTNSININTKTENYERIKILLIQEIQLKYLQKIDNFFKEYQNKVEKECNFLLPLAGKKDFKAIISKSDFEIKKYIEEMNICISKEMEEMNKEIENVVKKVLDDLECNLNQQKFTAIKDMVNNYFGIGVATTAFLGGGVAVGFGAGSVSSALIAINAGLAASIGVPMIGIVAGSIALLGGATYLLYRWLRNEKKYDKEAINNFKKKNEKEIKESQERIKDFIDKNIKKTKEKIKFYYGIDKENLKEFKNNIELFEKYYIEYENIMMESFGIN